VEASEEEAVVTNKKPDAVDLNHVIDDEQDSPAKVEASEEEAMVTNQKPDAVDLDHVIDDEEDEEDSPAKVEASEEEAVLTSQKPDAVDLNHVIDDEKDSPVKVEASDEEAVVTNQNPDAVDLDHVIDDEEDGPAKVEALEEEAVVTSQKPDAVDLNQVIDDDEEDSPATQRPSVNGTLSSEASSLAKAEVVQGAVVPLDDEEDELEIDTSIIESETGATPWPTRFPAGMKVIDENDESDIDDNLSQGSTGQLSASADADLGGSVESPGKRSSYFAKAREEFAESKADTDRAGSVDLPGQRPSYFAKAREEFAEAKEKEPEPPEVEERAPSPTFADEGVAFSLNHQLPGSDPTLRIQVHNDLIAWESKRRSQLSVQMEMNRERWIAAQEVIRDGVDEVKVAERLVLGFAKAGRMFADALQAMHDDKFLDNQGQTVTNSFVQKRLMNQRQKNEYSIENSSKGLNDTGHGGQSELLNSIIESQLVLASQFNDNSQHMEDEIFSEIIELRVETLARATELETLGESILAEMKRSETELKKIWGKSVHL
jgi:hypothetical protein